MRSDADDPSNEDCDGPKPRLMTVLGLLTLTSLTFSYLGAYAVATALVDAEVLRRWHPDADPRPRWFIIGFCVLLMTFVVVGGVTRHFSQRQMRQIDDMSTEV